MEVGFNQSTYSVTEAQGNVQVCVILESNAPIEKSITVTPVIIPWSATVDDFTAEENIQLNFLEVGVQCFEISIVDDQLLEDTERLSVVLVPSDPKVNVTQRSATVIIIDSESE